MAFLSKFSAAGLALAAVATANFTPNDSFAAPVQCNMSKAKINNAVGRSTTSTTSITLASMSFNQGGAGGCIVIQFSGETAVAAGEFLHIAILLDDISQIDIALADEGVASHSTMFPIAAVAPGTHNVKITMRSNGGDTVNIVRYTLAVFYVP